MLLDESTRISAGTMVRRTGRVVDIPVGEELLGRTIDPLGRPLDGREAPRGRERRVAERAAPQIMDRSPVTEPLQTGIQAIDALIPIGRGQRELILGDRQTGKTTVATDAIINQDDTDVVCVYCAIGKRASAVARVVDDLRGHKVFERTIVVVTTEDDPPGLNFIAPYTATSMAEYIMDSGRDALVVYDDLTRHARSYRELSLLLRRPPAREAYPGDIFYVHSRLLERATHLSEELGGGSLTALPIVETQEGNLSAYIPTNLISITDGQIYLNPELFQKGVLPAIDIGQSVSRVGGKTQLPAYREVAGDLKLEYSQFEELEHFSRFGVRLDEDTRRTLERGRRIREILKQPEHEPIPVPEQIILLLAVTAGVFDEVSVEQMQETRLKMRRNLREQGQEIAERVLGGSGLTDEDIRQLEDIARNALEPETAEA
jgi:F-type H+-transporting ATPase subunit alpha